MCRREARRLPRSFCTRSSWGGFEKRSVSSIETPRFPPHPQLFRTSLPQPSALKISLPQSSILRTGLPQSSKSCLRGLGGAWSLINLSTQSESHLIRIFTGSCTTRTHEDTRVHKAWARWVFSSNSKRKETLRRGNASSH